MLEVWRYACSDKFALNILMQNCSLVMGIFVASLNREQYEKIEVG